MKNETLYNKTVNILVQAYFNDTLQHRSCSSCAVGNIVTHNTGRSIYRKANGDAIDYNWGFVFCTTGKHQSVFEENLRGEAIVQINATGYKWHELAKIEYAFETASKGNNKDEWMFNGLMNVIEALDEIHENKDASVTEKSKQRFCKV